MQDAELVVIGSYVQDHVWLTDRFPAPGETRPAQAFHSGPGGKGFNQAIAAHRMGARTLFVGALGEDALGATVRRIAADERLPCRWQLVPDMPTAAAGIVVDRAGRNQISVFLGANLRLSLDEVPNLAALAPSASVVLLQLEIAQDTVMAALRLAAAADAIRILNPAPMPAELPPELLQACEVLTPNETEFAVLVEQVTGAALSAERVADLSDDALDAWCRRLDVPTVVVTLGAAGCFVSHADSARFAVGEAQRRYRIRAEAVQAIDTTGAGDAFNGALAAALARDPTAPFRDHVITANRYAALSTEAIGAADTMPTAAAVATRFGQ